MTQLNCNYFNNFKCRSCSQLALLPEGRVVEKLSLIDDLKNNLLQKDGFCVSEIRYPQNIFPSRSKAKLSVSGKVDNPIIGLVDKEFNGIELINCPLHLASINKLLAQLPDFLQTNQIPPYDICSRKGEIKGVIINSNLAETEIMLRFILRSTESIPHIKNGLAKLLSIFPELKVVSANIQPIPHQILEGEEEHLLTGTKYIFETYSNLKFAFGPRCFSQVTPEIANAIYNHARNIVEESKPKLLLDLYCGVGGFSLFTATHAERVIGIELSQEAIEAAKISAQLNNIRNASFYHADSNSFKNFVSGEQVEVIICNPPRRGIDKEIIEEIIKTNPREIIYSSCFIDTLARDLNLLSANYQITSLAPFEMFPLTKHLEIVAHLTKK